jgi:diamine N-acetyltransferase
MFIKGIKIGLRAVEPDDAVKLYQWENDVAIWPVSATIEPFSKFTIQQFADGPHDIYTQRQLRLMIVEIESSVVIGAADLYDFDPHHLRSGIGIFIATSHRGRGLAAETINLLLKYCFQILLLNQVYALVDAKNTDSLTLFTKCGFEKSGLQKQWNRTGNATFSDVWLLQKFNA